MEKITYAIVDGPPDDWQGLLIRDLDTGLDVQDVVEINTAEGWLIRCRRNERGFVFVDPENPDCVARERVEGRFEIRRPD